MRFTIFTPTYNRANLLPRLYQSLCRQSFSDFEWIIYDDGSNDDTINVVYSFIEEKKILIRLLNGKTSGGGKHRAINRSIKYAIGELFFIVDSDDYLTDDSLSIIDFYEKSINKTSTKYCGVAGLRGHHDGSPLGDFWSKEYIDLTHIERTNDGIDSDLAEVFYTNVLINYPFPEFDNEPFIRESVVWNRIARDGYKIRYFNKVIYLCEYFEDGLTANSNHYTKISPKGMALSISEEADIYGFNKRQRLNSYYWYYSKYKNSKAFNDIAEYLKIKPLLLKYFIIKKKFAYKIKTIFKKHKSN